MNIKHNKKRNTAFLYEILIKEMADAVYNKKNSYKKQVKEVLTRHFTPDSCLAKDYRCYQELYEQKSVDEQLVDKLITEVSNRRSKIDQKTLFNEQTALINDINKHLNEDIWSNFVEKYRFMGTLYHYFNSDDISAKDKVMLENSIAERVVSEAKREKDTVQSIDEITYNIYVEKFNDMYGQILNERQKDTIKQYIFSIEDGGLSFRNYLNEEIATLKEELSTTCEGENSICDVEINQKINEVVKLLEEYGKKPTKDEEIVPQILKMQQLVEEMRREEGE